MRFRTPQEKILLENFVLTLYADREKVLQGYRIVQLECGHHVFTKAQGRAHCPRCQQMWDSGEDWDGFRNHGYLETMKWPEDPLRSIHEPHAE